MNLAYNEKLEKLCKHKKELNAQKAILLQEVAELKAISKPPELGMDKEYTRLAEEMKGIQFVELLKKQLERLKEKNMDLQGINTMLNKDNDQLEDEFQKRKKEEREKELEEQRVKNF